MSAAEKETNIVQKQPEEWDQSDWERCEKSVKKLQARIEKAKQQGRWNKVKILQRTLDRSWYAKILAAKQEKEHLPDEQATLCQSDS